ncbi:MAG: DUF3833 domain-containing protein [Paracoccaceae bacterium]
MSIVLSVLIAVGVILGLAAIASRFVGFTTQKPADFAAKGPKFDPRTHLSGPILCEGVVYGPMGRVSSRFVADMEGVWDGNTGVLLEHFRYDTGVTQDRQWTLRLADDGGIVAEAPDVVGNGIGRAEGSAVEMRYRIKLSAEAGGHVLDVVDWMYLMENGTIMNRSQFRKFGIKVAELVATMRRVPQ